MLWPSDTYDSCKKNVNTEISYLKFITVNSHAGGMAVP